MVGNLIPFLPALGAIAMICISTVRYFRDSDTSGDVAVLSGSILGRFNDLKEALDDAISERDKAIYERDQIASKLAESDANSVSLQNRVRELETEIVRLEAKIDDLVAAGAEGSGGSQ